MTNLSLNDNKEKLITAFLIGSLMISCFMVSAMSTQPPIDTSTYYVGTIGQPSRMDPARAYDTASCELIQNVAQTLIWWDDKNVIAFTPGVGHNLTLSEYANLDSYTPVLATALPTIVVNSSGEYYTFTIRTTATFQSWTAASGSLIPPRNLRASDVIYSFRRQMVYDSPYAPTWMWCAPAFTGPASDGLWNAFPQYSNGTFQNLVDEVIAAQMILSWCYQGPGPNDVSFHFQNPWAQGLLNQIFARTWASIIEPEWVMERGGWNGSFFAGWTNLWHWKPTNTRSEIDAWKDPAIYGPPMSDVGFSKYPSSNKHVNEIMGTGPYMFTYWDQTNKIWRVDQFAGYWGGWAGNHVTTVIWKSVECWQTRKMLFLEGEFDVAYVPPNDMFDLLVTDAYHPAPGINLVYNIYPLRNEALFFTMNASAASPYQSFVGYPHQTGCEPAFFANEHIRRAFAWAFNYTGYIAQVYFGEAILQTSWWIDNPSLPERNLNYAEIQNELNLAVVDGINVGSAGFETTLLYVNGNDQTYMALQMIANAFQTLGSKYKCNIVGLDLPVFLDAMNTKLMPAYSRDWRLDFVDEYDAARQYMYSLGYFPMNQGPPFPPDQATIDAELTTGSVDYTDLQTRYYNDVISFGLVHPLDRRYARDWVQGWYYNQLFPGEYAYDIYKSVSALQNVDVATISVTPPSPTPSVTYIYHNQMRVGNGNPAPDVRTYTLTVNRIDANIGVATLLAAVGLSYAGPTGGKQFANVTYVALAPGGSASVIMTWWCDGVLQGLAGNSTGIRYTVAGETWPMNNNANDINPSNNVQPAGTLTAKTLPGDITGNGFVDIYDAIQLANAFGSKKGDKKFNADADLNGDWLVDIFDAIILAGNFNHHVP